MSFSISNRPFSTFQHLPLTQNASEAKGLMTVDGFFVSNYGKQILNAQFKNDDALPVDAQVYFESGPFEIVRATHSRKLTPGIPVTLSWSVNVSGVPAGDYPVSFKVNSQRIITKVHVIGVEYDRATNSVSATAPEGTLTLHIKSLFGPAVPCKPQPASGELPNLEYLIAHLGDLISQVDPSAEMCLPFYALKEGSLTVTYTTPFGKYSDLPFKDPWWKTVLAIIALILLIAVAVVAIVYGTPAIGAFFVGVEITATCCAAPAASALFASLGIGAIVSGALAGLSDERDPFRRGQDNTDPIEGELTTAEGVSFKLSYPEPLTLGTPFAVDAQWDYKRVPIGLPPVYSITETNRNTHVLTRYEIEAPNVVRIEHEETALFIVKARFFDATNVLLRGDQLYVQCYLEGIGNLKGQYRGLPMEDDGFVPDEVALDGTYTGLYRFRRREEGFWKIYVIAQDKNNATPNLKPEEAAQIIGGLVRTHQLTISFTGGTCKFVPDGEVHVL